MALRNDNHIMARPAPRIILEDIDDNLKALQVCEADAIYAVFYENRPVKVRTYGNIEIGYPGPKYLKTSFPSAGHAFNLAERLNAKFNTDQFTVVLMNSGRTIRER